MQIDKHFVRMIMTKNQLVDLHKIEKISQRVIVNARNDCIENAI